MKQSIIYKMAMPIVTLSLLAGSIISESMGESLAFYRKSVYKSEAASERESIQRRLDIEEKLNLPKVSLGESKLLMQKIASTPSSAHRFYSSIVFKDMLGKASELYEEMEKTDPPLVYNPAWTYEEHNAVLKKDRRVRCAKSINSTLAGVGDNSAIGTLLFEIQRRLVAPGSSDSGVSAKQEVGGRKGGEIIKLLAEYIENEDSGKGEESIFKKLGEIKEVQVVEGHIQKIVFSSGVDMTLTMLLTMQSGDDEKFLSMQQCLGEYLVDQKHLLEVRRDEIKTNKLAQAFSVIRQAIKESIAKMKNGQEKEALQAKDVRNLMETELAFFYEGKKFSQDQKKEELAWIEKRLLIGKSVIPFLQNRFEMAVKAHKQVAKLSDEQFGLLLALYLQLNENELPVAHETTIMGEKFKEYVEELAKQGDRNKKIDQAMADLQYYKTLGNLLTNLELSIEKQSKDDEALDKDLEEIQSRTK